MVLLNNILYQTLAWPPHSQWGLKHVLGYLAGVSSHHFFGLLNHAFIGTGRIDFLTIKCFFHFPHSFNIDSGESMDTMHF